MTSMYDRDFFVLTLGPAFVLLLLPFTIANLIQFRGRLIPFAFDVFVHACWSILGWWYKNITCRHY